MRAIRLLFVVAAVLGSSTPHANAQRGVAPPPAPRVPPPRKEFSMALVGDAIITRPLSPFKEPQFVQMIDLIRGADAAFANLEILFHDFEPYPMHTSGGTWMRAEPALAKELVWAGIDVVGMANNHTGDYGVEGMRLTRKYARDAGLVGAGIGEDLYDAREAQFFESANGRVALVSLASTFTDHSAATKPRAGVRGRPGLSPLRFTSTRVVTREQLDQLRVALRNAGVNAGTGNTLRVSDLRFAAGDTVGVRTEPDPVDVAEIAAVVRNAAKLSDYVVVSIHAHESGARNTEPAQFLVTFARAMIDAGADMFVGHGPHVLRGIEIYKGKPIFYSLGDFIFQNETLARMPYNAYAAQNMIADTNGVGDFNDARFGNDTRGFPSQREIWESVVAKAQWRGKELVAIALHPITLGFGLPASQRGRPMFADRALGEKIIGDLKERSARFGTTIEIRDGVGVVKVR